MKRGFKKKIVLKIRREKFDEKKTHSPVEIQQK
jgi:hypothetical protein